MTDRTASSSRVLMLTEVSEKYSLWPARGGWSGRSDGSGCGMETIPEKELLAQLGSAGRNQKPGAADGDEPFFVLQAGESQNGGRRGVRRRELSCRPA